MPPSRQKPPDENVAGLAADDGTTTTENPDMSNYKRHLPVLALTGLTMIAAACSSGGDATAVTTTVKPPTTRAELAAAICDGIDTDPIATSVERIVALIADEKGLDQSLGDAVAEETARNDLLAEHCSPAQMSAVNAIFRKALDQLGR